MAEALDSVGLPASGRSWTPAPTRFPEASSSASPWAGRWWCGPLLVADEPTSMLDASEQARLLVLLRERQAEMGLGLIFVSHDMAVVAR